MLFCIQRRADQRSFRTPRSRMLARQVHTRDLDDGLPRGFLLARSWRCGCAAPQLGLRTSLEPRRRIALRLFQT